MMSKRRAILVSACMAGFKVRYNGSELPVEDERFDDIAARCRLVPFCPEVEGGLGTPRPPAEISSGSADDVLGGRASIRTASGDDVSTPFINGAHTALQTCRENDIEVAILTERSPSCGSTVVYDGTFSGVRVPGEGVTTALLRKNGILVFSQYQLQEVVACLKEMEAGETA